MSTIKVADLQHTSNSNDSISIASDSSVALKHSGNAKLTTTATGIDITGACTATSFTGDGTNLVNVPAPSTFNAGNLTGTIPTNSLPNPLPAIDGSSLTGITAGALEHVADFVIPTNTVAMSIDIPFGTGGVQDNNTYLLKGYFHNQIGNGPYTAIYPAIYDESTTNLWNINTGLSYCDTYTTHISGYSSNQTSSYWQVYDAGWTDDHYYFEMKFSTYLGPIAYTSQRGLTYAYHLVDGCHTWTNNRDTSRIRGLNIRNHYGWNWDDKTKLSLYKYSSY
tara:strand:+ start:2649 stop:3485 length:837 start_codon:yes stop_codon:yes gene_type:complete